jgi:hypothetical protein
MNRELKAEITRKFGAISIRGGTGNSRSNRVRRSPGEVRP